MKHEYSFDQVDIDTNLNGRRLVLKRTPEPVHLNKSRGREDNMMYRVSDGYNLEPNDKTYFDKHNILAMLEASKSYSNSGYGSTVLYNSGRQASKTVFDIIKKATEQVRKSTQMRDY